MATTYNVAEITANVATLTGSPTFTASTRVTSTTVAYWFSQAVRAISALLRQKFPDDRDLVQIAVSSLPADTQGLALAANAGEVHAVMWIRDADNYVLLNHAAQDDVVRIPSQDWRQERPTYRIEAEFLLFYPPPSEDVLIEVYYTVNAPYGVTLQARCDVDQWIALHIAEKVALAKKQSPIPFAQARAAIENDLLSHERERDANAIDTIRDVRGEALRRQYRHRWRSG